MTIPNKKSEDESNSLEEYDDSEEYYDAREQENYDEKGIDILSQNGEDEKTLIEEESDSLEEYDDSEEYYDAKEEENYDNLDKKANVNDVLLTDELWVLINALGKRYADTISCKREYDKMSTPEKFLMDNMKNQKLLQDYQKKENNISEYIKAKPRKKFFDMMSSGWSGVHLEG